MPRNDREGTHLPFAHLFLDFPSKINIPVNWAKDEPEAPKKKGGRPLMETSTHINHTFRGVGIFVLNNEALMGRLQVKGLLPNNMSKTVQFGEMLEIPHPCEHLHKVNQIP